MRFSHFDNAYIDARATINREFYGGSYRCARMSVEGLSKGLWQREPTLDEELAALGEDDLVDMTNLPPARTGILGILFISTAMGSHGPRVKFFEKTGKGQPSFSVSVSESPHLLASSLSERDLNKALPDVIAWVKLNHVALLKFWNEGQYWDVDVVNRFIDGLKKI